jgi:hypothetical protein
MFWPVVPRAAPTQRAGVLPRHDGLACLGGAGNAIGPGVTAGVVAQGGRPGVRQVEVDGVGIAVSSVWPVSDVSEDPADRHLTPRELLRLPVTSPGEPAALVVSDMRRRALSRRPYGPDSPGRGRWPDRARLTSAPHERPRPRLQHGRTGLACGGCWPDANEASLPGRSLDLTPREFDFLGYLARGTGRVCTRRMILDNVWRPSYVQELHYLKVYA